MKARVHLRTTADAVRQLPADSIRRWSSAEGALPVKCYTPIFPRDPRFRMATCNQRVFFLLTLAFVSASLLTPAAAAQDWAAPSRELAEKIVARTQSRSALSLVVKNISSLPQARAAEIERALESELRRRGVSLAEPDRALEQAKVTLSENVSGYLWVAEVGHNDSWEVVMVQVAFVAPTEHPTPTLVLRRTALWFQPEPILDAATTGDGGLLVLGRDAVSLYRMQDRNRQNASTVALTHSHPWPRDLRGRLVVETGGVFRAYLPGVQCSGTMQPQLSLGCKESDDPWPLSSDVNAFFSSSRNFFTGTVKLARGSEAADLGPFYSAAMFRQSNQPLWLVGFTSGGARLINAQGQTVASFQGWGSDLASIASDCGSGWQMLTERAADSALPDALSAYEIVNRDAVEAAPPLEFAGPITAMWGGADGRSATAVSHNLRTGNYEAFSVSAVCGR